MAHFTHPHDTDEIDDNYAECELCCTFVDLAKLSAIWVGNDLVSACMACKEEA